MTTRDDEADLEVARLLCCKNGNCNCLEDLEPCVADQWLEDARAARLLVLEQERAVWSEEIEDAAAEAYSTALEASRARHAAVNAQLPPDKQIPYRGAAPCEWLRQVYQAALDARMAELGG